MQDEDRLHDAAFTRTVLRLRDGAHPSNENRKAIDRFERGVKDPSAMTVGASVGLEQQATGVPGRDRRLAIGAQLRQ
jgi:hypothetical protein